MDSSSRVPTIGVIRVVSSQDRTFLETHARLISEYLQGVKVRFVTECIREFPDGIFNEDDEKRAIPFVRETGISLVEEQGVDSLLISCAADPGVPELKKEVAVPVIGAGSASASFALLLGSRIGVLGIEENPPKVVAKMLGNNMVGYVRPEAVKTTHDINRSIDDYVNLTKSMIFDRKVNVLLLACTGLSTARIAPVLEKSLSIPVVDAVLASGLVAYYGATRKIIKRR